MTKQRKKPGSDDPISGSQRFGMENEKLFDFLNSKNFETIEELETFLDEQVVGKTIDEIVPKKRGPKSNLEKSDELIYQAYESSLSKGLKLAKESLRLNPKNIKAINYLADNEDDIDVALELYKQAVQIGYEELGDSFFEEMKGNFWLAYESRPYMSVKFNYAMCLNAKGLANEAVKQMYQMLELNPNDNQGVRYKLASILLRNQKYKQFKKLFDDYKEKSTFWVFNHALYLYATEGPSEKSYKELDKANKLNKHVLEIMTAQKSLDKDLLTGYYSPGSEEEATYYLIDNFDIWVETPDSADWLYSYYEWKKRGKKF